MAARICSDVNGYETSVRELPGTFIGDPATRTVRCTPPSGREVITEKLDEWESDIHGQLFMLKGVRSTAELTLDLIDDIQQLQMEFRTEIRENPVVRSDTDLLDLLFERPYLRTADVVDRCSVSRPTASKWLNDLVKRNQLRTVKAGRERLFINWRLL